MSILVGGMVLRIFSQKINVVWTTGGNECNKGQYFFPKKWLRDFKEVLYQLKVKLVLVGQERLELIKLWKDFWTLTTQNHRLTVQNIKEDHVIPTTFVSENQTSVSCNL